jgi:hypothetical protein
MAGATNKAMKAAGLPSKTIETTRVARGGGLTVQSAIQHAQAHGLKLGRAEKHATPLTGWQKAAAGATSQAEHAAARSAREAHVAAESRKAALKAAMDTRQRNLGRALRAAGRRALATRKAAAADTAAWGGFGNGRSVGKVISRENDGTTTRAIMHNGEQIGTLGHTPADRHGPASWTVIAKHGGSNITFSKQEAIRDVNSMPVGLPSSIRHGAVVARKAAAEAARPKFKGAGPFNVDRHKARAMALSDVRKTQLKAADAKLQAAKTPEERATANKEYNIAQRRADNAAALNRAAGAKVSERDAVRRGEKGTTSARMRQARADVAGLRAPGKGQAHIITAEGPKVVDTVASSKNFFVHKEPGYGGQFVVSHRSTGMGIASVNNLSAAKAIMNGMRKTGERTMARIEAGGKAGERSAKAMQKYLSAPKRRSATLAERGMRAGTAPTKRGKEANAAAGIR